MFSKQHVTIQLWMHTGRCQARVYRYLKVYEIVKMNIAKAIYLISGGVGGHILSSQDSERESLL